ncbi:MAG: hypothetical protein ACXADY_03055 [Candidatus Hodarchaeales archaeon]
MVTFLQTLILAEKIDFTPLEILNYLQVFSKQIIELFSSIFPVSLSIAIVTVNISLISGAIVYLLGSSEENGKMMIFRSLVILLILISIFNPNFPNSTVVMEPFEGFQPLTSFLTSYLLFIFAALSLIVFLGNLGLYIIESDSKRIKNLKKSVFCLICIILPLGFQFPNMPLWMT